jgi:hypothetical protein
MPKTSLASIGIACALLLAGCDTPRDKGGGIGGYAPFVPRPDRPNLLLAGGAVVLDQDPLVFDARGRGTPKTITWRLDPNNSEGLTFDPKVGILVADGKAADEFTECGARGPHVFTCSNRHTKAGKYNYVIQLRDRGGRAFKPVDPVIINL